jgi:hypothetical protein
MPRHDLLQLMQAPVEEVFAARHHHDGQILLARPV